MTFISSISYRDKKWYDKRKKIIERDNHTCTRCGRKLSDDQLQVHHIILPDFQTDTIMAV